MADLLKVLGQTIPIGGNLVALYTVPSNSQSSISTLVICNQNNVGTSFNISVSIGGAADTPAQYIYYQIPLDVNDTFTATIGISLSAGDVIRCLSSTGNVSFNLFGVEITNS